VVPFPGTELGKDIGRKFIRKNRKYYSSWIEKVRREIDLPMLKRLFPEGTILKNVISEIHEGNVTFLRQLGSYPIVVGVRERLPLHQVFDIEVTGQMFRSLVGRIL
jgi:radical SAM superfamily enzyme with C-terminal helix-hairpin-helix motif